MPRSRKTAIIEELFSRRWRGDSASLSDPQVSLSQVAEAIERHNAENPESTLSTKNPANFFKDFIRNKRSANANWPESVFSRGYTARQVTSHGLCFRPTSSSPGRRSTPSSLLWRTRLTLIPARRVK